MKLQLNIILPLILMAGLFVARAGYADNYSQKRPTIKFNGIIYELAGDSDFRSFGEFIESYLPQGQDWSNFDSVLQRVELSDVLSNRQASEGLAFEFRDLSLPYKFLENADSNEIMLMGTMYSKLHPLVVDKHLFIFKNFPQIKQVVYYRFLKREFNHSKKDPLADKENLYLPDKYIKLMKELDME